MKPKIFLLANNLVGLQIAQFLKEQNANIVALAVHAGEKRKLTDEIIKTVDISPNYIFEGPSLRKKETLDLIKKLKPDIIIAAFWGYILKPELLQIPPMGSVNFHPGYLPYNRGMNPNVWPIIENTPAGVTIHYIDEGIDTGDIIGRKKIEVEPIDTGGSLYEKTLVEIVDLFKEIYPKLITGKIKPIKQEEDQATFHWAKDINTLDKIELDKTYKARDLINLIRARTYDDKAYAYFESNGKKVKVRLTLEYDE